MKKIFYILPIVALSLFSCESYLDINEDPNNITIDQVTPTMFLPGAQLETYKTQVTDMNRLGNVFTNAWAANVYSFTGGFSDEYTLNTINTTFYDQIWDETYKNVGNFQAIIDYPNADGSQDNYVAIAKIMKTYYAQTLVDLYGDMPYSEAWQQQGNVFPKYDDDFEIYKALYANLESAQALIAGGNGSAVGAEDISFGGNMGDWDNLANILKVKLLVRMSDATTPAVVAYRNSKATALAGTTFVTKDLTVNPGFNSSNDDQMNPWLKDYRINSAGTAPSNFNFVRASKHQADFFNGVGGLIPGNNPNNRNYPTFNDPRGARLWEPGVVGNEQGATSLDNTTFPNASDFGILTFWPHYNLSPITIPNLAAVDGYVMTKAEQEFILAEASIKFPGLGLTGSTHFSAGIQDSFDYLFVNLGGYPGNIASVPGLGWTGTNNDKIEAIMTQKWIALTSQNAIQSYIDYTRTGFPVTPLATTTTKANKPYRLMYPASEYATNSANVPSISNADLFTVNSTTPFWKN